ncbi:MAG: hypothetical protein JNG89_06080 [Planctomycetaceae bacterium]|nr:hypothetical protein [Planctomycetaceae bacterium]
MLTYEQQLSADRRLALREGSMHFEGESGVHKALERICRALDERSIPYCILGGMALFFHGYRRFTEDVDLLVTPDGLKAISEELTGRGYLPPFSGSRNLRDTETGVRIEFVMTGEYPGDGKPKPVAFPSPEANVVEIDGMRFVTLPKLIELKLASGISNPRRARDLADVQELIALLRLPADFQNQLDASVRDKYAELQKIVQDYPE